MTTYLYVGFGDFVPGVPARDLSAEEWDAVPEEWREVAEALYQAVEREDQEVRTRTNADERGQEEEATTEGAEDGREDAGAVDDDPAGAADGGEGHRGVRRPRRGEAEG